MPNVKLDEHSPAIRLHMITTQTWLDRVDAYAEENQLTRSQAIRRLIDAALGGKSRRPSLARVQGHGWNATHPLRG